MKRPLADLVAVPRQPSGEGPVVFSRRSLLLMASTIALGSASRTMAKPGRGRLSIGLSAPSYYNGFCPFLNWWKQGAPFQIQLDGGRTLAGKEIWNAGIYLDASTGELASPVPPEVISLSRIFFTNTNSFQEEIGCNYSGEEFSIVWEGSAQVNVDFLTAGAAQEIVEPNHIRFKMGADPANTSVTFTVTDANDPPRNVRIYQTRYERQVRNGAIFNPDWIEVISQFGLIRCMDWCAVNNSSVAHFQQFADREYCSWGQTFSSSTTIDDHGPKGGVHPAILCDLANETGVDVQVCIPHRATDECVVSLANYFRDHARVDVIYELGNECWNPSFTQFGDFLELGNSIWPDDPLRAYKHYGYRAATCLNLVRRVYGASAGWSGALATQTANAAVTEAILSGVEHWRANDPDEGNRPAVSDLFRGLHVTGYFGDVTTCAQPEAITHSDPGIVKSPNHGYVTGQAVRCFFLSGMTELNQRDVTVRKIDDDTYAIDVDTRSFGAFTPDTRNYVVPSALFKLMDESRERHMRDPDVFQTRYAYFNQQVSLSLLEGRCDSGFSTVGSVAALRASQWPAQLALARANGLTLQQYEGGCHLVGDAYLTGYGGNSQYTEYLLQHGHSREIAVVYSAMYDSFLRLGGQYPSKYVADGVVSQFGAWAGVRYWPTAANRASKDTGNPVWEATMAANRPTGR